MWRARNVLMLAHAAVSAHLAADERMLAAVSVCMGAGPNSLVGFWRVAELVTVGLGVCRAIALAGSVQFMLAEGWFGDPYFRHDKRWFTEGVPTALVDDDPQDA